MGTKTDRPLFHPTFGSRPRQIVGRDKIIDDFLRSLSEPVGSRERCTFFVGQRGMGKTALLLELAERADREGYITASVTCYDRMNEEIIEIIQRKGNKLLGTGKKEIQGIEAGAMGFSFGLTFSDKAQEQFGFRTKLTMLAEKLEKYGKGIVVFVDEAKTSDEMRQLAVTYQHLVGENRDIAICMAGLPQSISGVLNDDVLTFLNRAKKVNVGPISLTAIRDYYQTALSQAGVRVSEDGLKKAAAATRGFPYMMQLVGYYLIKYDENQFTEEQLLNRAVQSATEDIAENVFAPILKPLSENDMAFLKAMSEDEGISKVADICRRMGKPNSFIQPYRTRLIEGGIIESPRKGELEFAVPYLADYLRSQDKEDFEEL